MITIDGYPIDAAIVEEHTLDNEVTDNPIEKGGVTTDHSYSLPDEITLECVVSDTPIGRVRELRDNDVVGQTAAAPSEDAYQRMRFIRKRNTSVTITTSKGVHENMLLTKLGVPVRADDGKALRFRVTFKLATFVTNERTVVRVAVPQQARRVNRGNKPAKPPDPPTTPETKRKASVLYKLIH